ncbi:UDP-2,3-diacylglucosamine diphosphatase [Donghicola sp. C2-DW-16]|uniref:UDP-2,3-diacylglucosamine diphosphatase n=1 Tax=Donghicola mangrovi TaxID=2729614 RepID=A0ABX2PFS8_9RHOB|nr:UDP-2,3-diacylglucosamine diphosphatase [Donghicola mangrovi]NVO28040.1 UDP-2,3-diacylglucosamine diphosphatase [Donghicola mangrovi]
MLPFKEIQPDTRISCRSIFLSDWHLGARAANPATILSVLRNLKAQNIYLVGDILDIWHGGRIHWSAEADEILSELRRMARAGAHITYLPGNHDAPMRSGAEAPHGGWKITNELIHETADGRRFLVIHGDQCDSRLFRQHFMTRLGSRLDSSLRWLDNIYRKKFALERGQQTPFEWIISKSNELMSTGYVFDHRALSLATAVGADGVICGHSHKPAMREWDGKLFANCGDWVDGMTGLVERFDGTLELLDFSPVAHAVWAATHAPEEAEALAEVIG